MKRHLNILHSMACLLMAMSVTATLCMLQSCGGGDDDKGTTPTASITPATGTSTTYTLAASDTSLPGSFGFTATSAWTATLEKVSGAEPSEWITVTPMSGKAGSQKLTITVRANTTNQSRGARLKIKGDNNTFIATITQKAKEDEPSPSKSIELSSGVADSYTVSAEATGIGNTIDFKAYSGWTTSLQTVSGTPASEWITLTPSQGTAGNRKINVTLSVNESTDARSGRIIIQGENNSVSILVNQGGATDPDVPDEDAGTTQTYTVNGVSFKMIGVAGGTYTMGATSEQGTVYVDDEKPTHQVTLAAFSLAETEVTQELWTAVMGENPSTYYQYGNKLPVETVSYNECISFITKLNQLTNHKFRLPTEAEWEYAARGGASATTQYMYSGSNTLTNVGWYYDNTFNSDYRPHAVKMKTPNILGLYDMSGNVWEWCADFYGAYSSASASNPKGPTNGSWRVLRGGAWSHKADGCRVSKRWYSFPYNPGVGDGLYGLRLAL